MNPSKNLLNYIPVLPMQNFIIFPGQVLPIRVSRRKGKLAIDKVLSEEEGRGQGPGQKGKFISLAQKKGSTANLENVTSHDLHEVGTLCEIVKVQNISKGNYHLVVKGLLRYRVDHFDESQDYIAAEGEAVADIVDLDETTTGMLIRNMKDLALEILNLVPGYNGQLNEQISDIISGTQDLSQLAFFAAQNLNISLERKQEVLEMVSLKNRALKILELMSSQKEALKLQNDLFNKISGNAGKAQREYILREQLKAIKDELGEGDEVDKNNDYRKKIEDAGMTPEAKKVALEQLGRLETMGNASPEAHIIRTYLDLLVDLPWSKRSPESFNLESARAGLDKDHYGLDQIKKRIIQHLAVMKLRKDKKGSILLFVGPPGVGKTSLGQSIAKALGREFIRVSLGGVRDDAEIRGHRRTYIGAIPGRIIQGIRRSGTKNPVFMLDEIDKLSRGFGGDPASALLEVLDPEQNSSFLDHYLDVPFDLSDVFFIGTANNLETIPPPLLDRMEVISLSGYTTAEKLHISQNHLLPKQLAEHGIGPDQVVMGEEIHAQLITDYTREAGVRELQRLLAAICRACSEKIVKGTEPLPLVIQGKELEEILGPPKFVVEVAELTFPPGVVTGLAWTPVGGEILFVEASLMDGSGRLTLTGQLGDVMKESAQIALSLCRSRLPHMSPDFLYDKKDIHIHVPAGAIPKDGPSAGITMMTTLASLILGRTVDPKLAMTGELTLRGAVMPVGGIKEKVLAAHRAGIQRVILPKQNRKDLRDVPADVQSAMSFEFVSTVAEVLKAALDIEFLPEEVRIKSPPAVRASATSRPSHTPSPHWLRDFPQ